MIPNIRKTNNRYRGPQESKKMLATKNMARYNLKILKEKVVQIKNIVDETFPKDKEKVINIKVLSLYNQIKKDIETREGEICE